MRITDGSFAGLSMAWWTRSTKFGQIARWMEGDGDDLWPLDAG